VTAEMVEVETWRENGLGQYHKQGETADGLETTELSKKTVTMLALSPCRTCYPDAYDPANRRGCRCVCGGCCCS